MTLTELFPLASHQSIFTAHHVTRCSDSVQPQQLSVGKGDDDFVHCALQVVMRAKLFDCVLLF